MLFFTASFDVTVESWCITYVTVDLVCIDFPPFCISECIGPESFSAWNLLWHLMFKSIVLEPYVTVDLSAERCIACRLRNSHRSTDANCKIKIYCDVTRHSIQVMAARICKRYMQMRQIMRRNIPRIWRRKPRTNNLQSN
jgi:hypothetical protein